MKRILLFAVGLVVIVSLFFIGQAFLLKNQSPVPSYSEAQGEPLSLTIAEGQQPAFALIYIADKLGFFQEQNLTVDYVKVSSGRDALSAALAGEADIATVYETPVVLESYRGADIGVITALHSSQRNTALVYRLDTIATPTNLAGKRIAVTVNTNGDFFLQQVLNQHGLSVSDVTIVDTAPTDMVEAITSGSVDALVTWNTHLFDVRRRFKTEEIGIFFSDEYTEFSVLAGSREVIAENSEAMRRLVAALQKAEVFLRENDRDAQGIVVETLPQFSPVTIRAVWPDTQRTLGLPNSLIEIFNHEGDFFEAAGVVAGPKPNFASLLMPDYL